jgi:4'-phosphopantetheinyl transferase
VSESCRFENYELPLGSLELPEDGLVHLWFLDLKKLGSPLLLDEEGGEDTVLKPRHERTIRRFYLRLLLGAYLGVSGKDVRISRMVKGKPVLDPNVHRHPLEFSSAGSNAYCLIGISTAGQLGVDLESAGRKTNSPRSLARRYFSEQEQRGFDSLEGKELDRAFLHTWACKEAVVKAAGHGIANQLCRFTVDINPDADAKMLDIEGDSADEWQLSMVKPANGFVACIASRNKQLRLKGFTLNQQSAASTG